MQLAATYDRWFRIDHDETRLHAGLMTAKLKERQEGIIARLAHQPTV